MFHIPILTLQKPTEEVTPISLFSSNSNTNSILQNTNNFDKSSNVTIIENIKNFTQKNQENQDQNQNPEFLIKTDGADGQLNNKLLNNWSAPQENHLSGSPMSHFQQQQQNNFSNNWSQQEESIGYREFENQENDVYDEEEAERRRKRTKRCHTMIFMLCSFLVILGVRVWWNRKFCKKILNFINFFYNLFQKLTGIYRSFRLEQLV